MDLYEQIREKLAPVEAKYDIVRLINPIDKKSIIIKDKEIKNIEGTCYDYWKRGESCTNCISKRTYIEKDTFIKIEYTNKVILVTSTPVYIDGETYVVEMLKDLSRNGKTLDINSNSLSAIINEINEKPVSDGLLNICHRQYIYDDYNKIDDNRLVILNSKIEELRDILNEMCISDDGVEDKEKIVISQYLDELIVEYMKDNMQQV